MCLWGKPRLLRWCLRSVSLRVSVASGEQFLTSLNARLWDAALSVLWVA